MTALLGFYAGTWAVAIGLVMEFLDFDGLPVAIGGVCLLAGLVAGLASPKGMA